MNLRAGEDGPNISLTDSQVRTLGLPERPERIGCGKDACVYAAGPGNVVKVTRDAGDAWAFWSFLQRTEIPRWVVPVHAVYRIKNAYAIRAARASALPKEWAEPIDELYALAEDEDHDAEDWPATYSACMREIEWREAEHGGATADDRRMRQALMAVDSVVNALRFMGYDWGDYHSGNWGLLNQERPVVIDLGRIEGLTGDPVAKRVKSIPVLPY